MTPAATSEDGKHKRKWKKLWLFVLLCAVAIGLLFAPPGKGDTVHFLAGMVLGLSIGGIIAEFSNSP